MSQTRGPERSFPFNYNLSWSLDRFFGVRHGLDEKTYAKSAIEYTCRIPGLQSARHHGQGLRGHPRGEALAALGRCGRATRKPAWGGGKVRSCPKNYRGCRLAL